MSFILEALKKSDKERRQGLQPDVFSPHVEPPSFSSARRGSWGLGLAATAAIGLIAGIVLFFIYFQPLQKQPPAADGTQTEQAAKIATAPPVDPSPQTAENDLLPIDTDAVDVPAEQVGPTVMDSAVQYLRAEKEKVRYLQKLNNNSHVNITPLEIRSDAVKKLAELSPALRHELPELKFAGHTYSNSPSSRLIIINGQILRENQQIDSDLRLVEITEDGVILEFRGTLFSKKLY